MPDDHAVPDHTVPDHTVPDHTVSDHTVPDHAVPDHMLPDHAVPDHTVPDDVLVVGARWQRSVHGAVGYRQARWRERWRASGIPARILAVAAIAMTAAALGVGGVALRTQPRHYERTVTPAAVPGRITVDSSGCPVGVRCAVSARVEPDLAAAVLRAFPGAAIVSSVVVRDAGSGRTYRRVMVARLTRTTVIVAAQCIPGTPAGPRRVLRAVPGPMVAGSLVTYSHRLAIVVPGRDGCSASIEADVTGVKQPNDAPIFALADDPAVRSTP